MWPNQQFPADLVTFTEEILTGKLHFLCSVSCEISKHNITIPRLKLISTIMGANLVQNVKPALTQSVRSVTVWTDSTVVLYWLNEKGNYRQFVENKVNKITEKEFINWCYISTKENLVDVASRRSLIANIPRVWWEGPSWLPK